MPRLVPMARPITFCLHPRIHNKPPHWEPGFASDWERHDDTTLDDLKAAVSAGQAFVPAAMSSSHRSSAAFDGADLAVVDIDHGTTEEELLQQSLVTKHACFVYTTPSHDPANGKHRFRVGFLLPFKIREPELHKAVVTLLSRALGGDKAALDPARLFYGNSNATWPLWEPDRILPDTFIDDAEKERAKQALNFSKSDTDFDELTLARAAFVLEQVLEPSVDGDRDRFIRVTAAAAGAGEELFTAWSDWASRGHHGSGKNARQATRRFFAGFSGRSTPATLFFLADAEQSGWREQLPDELKQAGTSFLGNKNAIGYDLGSYEDFDSFDALVHYDPDEDDSPQSVSASLFDEDAPWRNPQPRAARAVSNDDYDDDADVSPPDAPAPKSKQASTIDLASTALKRLYPGLRMNLTNLELEYGPLNKPRLIEDPSMLYLHASTHAGKDLPKNLVHDLALSMGRENGYHPVRAYLTDCASRVEPCPYFDTIATTLLGVDEPGSLANPYLPTGRCYADEVMRRFLIGAVARVMQPGCAMDWMPILVGGQSAGKTNFFTFLTPPDPNNANVYSLSPTVSFSLQYVRDRPHALHAGWIVILDEIDRLFKRQYVEDLKNLISTATDRSAKKYQNERGYPRSFVMAGATNARTFLLDPTGNRRFFPIRIFGVVPSPESPQIRTIDLDRLKADRDALWAAAYKAYLAKEGCNFTSYEIALTANVADGFTADNPVDSKLRSVLESRNSGYHKGDRYLLLSDVYEWLDVSIDKQGPLLVTISDALKRLGWQPVRRRIGGEVKRIWVKESSAFQSAAADPEVSNALTRVQAAVRPEP